MEDGTGAAPKGALTELLEALARTPEAPEAWAQLLRPGDVLDRFEILRELGRGAFGAVYEALDRELGRKVALKTLRPGRTRDEWSDSALRREAQAAASLSHPGVVTLFEAATCDRGPYLAMELLRGETLEARLARGPLPIPEVVEVGLQVARALAHVHGAGLAHRDLKPGNVHLGEDGRVKLLDLGLAHILGRKAAAAGTPAYAPPEQWRADAVDARADVFALGVVLHEMAAGRRPFEVREGRSTALDGPAPALGGKAPRRLARLVGRCLAADPAARPTAAQAAEALLELQRALERPGGNRRVALVAAVGLAAGLSLGAAALWRLQRVAPGPDGRIRLAVADVANETRDPDLDGLSGLLVTSLEQSKRLRVLTRSRMLDLLRSAGREGLERIDEHLAREAARLAGVQVLLLASVRRFEDVYVVELKALDPGHDDYLFTVQERDVGKVRVPQLVDRVSESARRRLRESRAEVRADAASVGQVVTANLEAYRHYFEGQRLDDELRFEEAMVAYRRALALEPAFGLAHYALSMDLRITDAPQSEREAHAEAAFREVARLPAKEGLLVRAWQARSRMQLRSSRELYREAVEAFPDDKRALYLAADLELRAFQEPETARLLLERSLALDPRFAMARWLMAATLLSAGRTDEALSFARGWLAESPSQAALWWVAVAHLCRGETDEALAVARRRSELAGGTDPYGLLADVHLVRDEPRLAEALLAALAAGGHDRLYQRSVVALYRGRLGEADALAREALAAEPSNPVVLQLRVAQLAAAGAGPAMREAVRQTAERARTWSLTLANAVALAGELELARELVRPWEASWASRFVDALERRAAGDLSGARAALEGLATGGVDQNRQAALFALGETCHAAGDDPCALAAFESFRWIYYPYWQPWRAWAYPRSLLLSAKSLERLGRRGEARAVLDRLLETWGDADRSLRPLAEARALRSRLAAVPERAAGG